MTGADLRYETMTEETRPAFARILIHCFGFTPELLEKEMQISGFENWRTIRQGETVVGGLGIIEMDHHYGGRLVRGGGIICVGVAPHRRARGAAAFLMTSTVRDLRERGYALSSLYPSNLPTYRRAGYEIAGRRYAMTMETQRIPNFDERGADIEEIEKDDWSGLEKVQAAINPRFPGRVRRDVPMWKYYFGCFEKSEVYGFVLRFDGEPEAGILYTQKEGVLHAREMEASTMRGARALWTFLRDHRSMVREVRWTANPNDLMVRCLPAWPKREMHVWPWMLRVVDAKAALEQRGYNRFVEGELHLDIQDETVPDFSGRFVLSVKNGEASVQQGGDGVFKTWERPFAAMYGGAIPASQLAWTGGVDAPAEAVELADALFAGPEPYLQDDF